jgi:hypothetical protein
MDEDCNKYVDPIRQCDIARSLLATAKKTRIERIASELGNCAEAWEADVCLLGNVTAEEIRDLCKWVREQAEGGGK